MIFISQHQIHLRRMIRWSTVALYTAALPYVILVFRAIDRHLSSKVAANVPLFIIILFAIAYSITCVKKKAAGRCVIILMISAVIVFFIMTFETIVNKHIHIPEYVLMAWMLYQALSIDYKGSGIFLLIFICAAMLGIVDELMQGIHPERTYGWTDMLIDAASGFIGILTLMGLKDPPKRNWAWLGQLKNFKGSLAAVFLGAVTAVLMCVYLFDVQNQGTFWKVYPRWLLGCNGLFLAAAAAIVFQLRYRHGSAAFSPQIDPTTIGNHTTARLWVLCPLAILSTMHALVMWVAVAGLNFS